MLAERFYYHQSYCVTGRIYEVGSYNDILNRTQVSDLDAHLHLLHLLIMAIDICEQSEELNSSSLHG